MENNIELRQYLDSMISVRSHQPSGPIYKNLHKRKALLCIEDNEELRAICSLVESHAPTFRIKTTYRYDRILRMPNANQKTMNKEHMLFNCPVPIEDQIKCLTDKIKEMPKEWTIIQITTQFNLEESLQVDMTNIVTDPLHISVFNCGQNNIDPFCMTVEAPVDLSGENIELCKEMHTITNENKNLLQNYIGDVPIEKITFKQKKLYSEHRSFVNNRLKDVVIQMQSNWLREWKCLFIGKFINENVEKKIQDKLNAILATEETFRPSKKILYILGRIVACSPYLSSSEMSKAIHYCIPDHKELKAQVVLMLMESSNSCIFKNAKRYPVILIVDEKLDCFCWEMIDVLLEHPVSRMPSLHFTYALFKEHERSIVNGFKQIHSKDGKYIINPGLDLKKMEIRLSKFFEYWLPEWKGLVGETPTSDQFSEFLNDGDIFVYNGHGSGTQFLSGSKIQQMRVNGVVLLFGCGSVRMQSAGSLVEMHDVFHNYMIACSPCVVGMLWEVTDFDTDILSTDLLSRWIPSKAKTPWNQIDRLKWGKGIIVPTKSPRLIRKGKNECKIETEYEPELLRAISQARKAPTHNITKAAIVARGLPVKICDNSL